jgi:hypothetical protein
MRGGPSKENIENTNNYAKLAPLLDKGVRGLLLQDLHPMILKWIFRSSILLFDYNPSASRIKSP